MEEEEEGKGNKKKWFGALVTFASFIYENFTDSPLVNAFFQVTKYVFTVMMLFFPSEVLFIIVIITIIPKNMFDALEVMVFTRFTGMK